MKCNGENQGDHETPSLIRYGENKGDLHKTPSLIRYGENQGDHETPSLIRYGENLDSTEFYPFRRKTRWQRQVLSDMEKTWSNDPASIISCGENMSDSLISKSLNRHLMEFHGF